MQSLKLKDDQDFTDAELLDARLPLSFRDRQFHLEPTARQQRFDWIFGVGLPLVCFAADPLVFSDEHALLYEYKTFAYALSIASIMGMAAWLLWGQRLGDLKPYLGGLFLAGSFISLIIGVVLLPFSLIGMFFIIGFLGFTPLFFSFVYLRNGVRAINGAKLGAPTKVVYQAVILAVLYSLIVPFVFNF
jgi:hypothetical protein